MMRQIWNRLQLMCAQGVATVIGADKVQVRVLDGETLGNVERAEPYGFSYRPKAGSRAHLFFPAGDRSYGVALVIGDKRYQVDLQEGEVALHDDQGQIVHLKRDGILIDTPFNLEVRATNIKLHATGSYQFDCNGQGQRWDGQGVETWQDDDVPRPHHNHAAPEI